MSKFLNIPLLASLLALSVASAQLMSCSAEKPTRYTSSAKTGSKGKNTGDQSGKGQKDKDGEDLGSGADDDADADPDQDDKNTDPGSDMDNDPVVDPMPDPKDPVIPTPDPDPVPDPKIEAQKKLEEACTITDVQIVNSHAQAYQLFMSAFGDAKADLISIAKKDCLAMYRDVSEFRSFKKLTVTIDSHDGVAYANPGLDRIFFSSKHILNYANASANDRKIEMWGVMTHEINHLYQKFWKQSPQNPAFSEGLCDAIRADSDLYPRSRKQKGGNVYGSYTTTGFFLRYMRKAKDPDFYWKFNKAAQNWKDSFWMENFGMTVDQLWDEFQAKGFDPNDY